MRIAFQTKNTEVPQRFEQHAKPRLENLTHYSSRLSDARVVLTNQRGRHRVEITLTINGDILRGEDYDRDSLTSFDRALDKVQRQLERFKSRFEHKGRHTLRTAEAPQEAAPPAEPPEAEEDLGLEDIQIVRTKAHLLKPMTPEEAALQMEMVGHDFFVFFNGESERVGVVYRRKDGGYGLIEPEIG